MDLFFCVEEDVYGVTEIYNLKENGNNIKLNFGNKEEYVELYLDYYFNVSVKRQFSYFYNGFRLVMDSELFMKFSPIEVKKALCGKEDLNFNDMRETAAYTDGYDKDHRIIIEFWDILFSFSDEDKKKFLKFLTGSDRAPLKGLREIRLTISRASPDSENLPSSHTCFNHLLIPEYSDKQKFENKLRMSINNYEGFGLF